MGGEVEEGEGGGVALLLSPFRQGLQFVQRLDHACAEDGIGHGDEAGAGHATASAGLVGGWVVGLIGLGGWVDWIGWV